MHMCVYVYVCVCVCVWCINLYIYTYIYVCVCVRWRHYLCVYVSARHVHHLAVLFEGDDGLVYAWCLPIMCMRDCVVRLKV
jgi:hypothetical protein